MAKVAVFVSVGASASMGGMLEATSDVVSDAVSVGTIVAFPLVEINRIARIAIPPKITVSATRLRSGRVASDGLFTIRPFRALMGLLHHILYVAPGILARTGAGATWSLGQARRALRDMAVQGHTRSPISQISNPFPKRYRKWTRLTTSR
jgi:hypothetical protein